MGRYAKKNFLVGEGLHTNSEREVKPGCKRNNMFDICTCVVSNEFACEPARMSQTLASIAVKSLPSLSLSRLEMVGVVVVP